MGIECYGVTDRGKERRSNEDQFLIAELGRALILHRSSLPLEDQAELKGPAFAQLLAVADGVGGVAGGERASYVAVRSILEYTLNMLPWCVRVNPNGDDDLVDELRFALERCQSRLEAEASRDPRKARMATTLTMAFVIWPRAWVLHVGDSRCYHMRDGVLQQVTTDHTVAREMARHGAITDSGVKRSRWRNVLWNALGGESTEMDPKVHRVDLELGDALLLCTDGLTEHVPEAEIASTLLESTSPEESCCRLVERANAEGGTDNITCVVARFSNEALATAETVRILQ